MPRRTLEEDLELLEYGARTGVLTPTQIRRAQAARQNAEQYGFQGIPALERLERKLAPFRGTPPPEPEPTAYEQLESKIGQLAELTDQDPELLMGKHRWAMGETEDQHGSGILNKVFDFLSRGNYAAAESQKRGLESQKEILGDGFQLDDIGRMVGAIPDVAGGFVAGLTGREKTTFDDYLNTAGMAEGWQRSALGLGLDVVADPTNLVGGGLTKGVAKEAARTAAARTVGKDLTAEILRAQGDGVIRRAARAELRSTGQKVTAATVRNKIMADVEALYFPKSGINKIDEVAQQLMTDGAGTVDLKFAGMPIFRSKKLYKAGSAVAETVGRRSDGSARVLNRAFRRQADLPAGLDEVLRVGEIANEGAFAEKASALREIFFKDLNPEQRKEIMFALDENRSLLHVPSGSAREGFKSLESYKLLAERMFKQMADEEEVIGALKPGGQVNNYTYRIFRKNSDEAKKLFNTEVLNAAGNSKIFKGTLREAAQKGYDPVLDIGESLAARYAKHFSTKARHQFNVEAISRFGTVPKNKAIVRALENAGFKKVDNLGKAYFPEPIANALKTTRRMAEDPTAAKELMDLFDKVLGNVKFLQTGANPGFHLRNSFSDVILNASDGVMNPHVYKQARDVLSNRTEKAVLRETAGFTPSNPAVNAAIKGKQIKVGKEYLDSEEVWNMFIRSGGKSGYIKAELDQLLGRSAGKKAGTSIKSRIMDASETREDFFRLAHFIDSLGKEAKGLKLKTNGHLTPEALAASDKAARRVRKFNIDYGAKTDFEKKFASRALPFYTWMRKNLPLQVELLFTNPGFMSLYPKGQNFLENILGTDEQGTTLLPEWIRELAPVKLATEKKFPSGPVGALLKLAGIDPGQMATMTTSGTPITDLTRLDPIIGNISEGRLPNLGEVAGQFASDTNAALKAPFEAATGRYTFSGAPIGSWQEYLANQIPIGRQTYGAVSNGTGESQNPLFRYLTGLDVRPITEEMQQGEFRRREDALDPQIQAIRMKQLMEILASGRYG